MKNTPRKLIISTLAGLIILFFLYALWWPSSQVFWRTAYKTNDESVLLTFDDGPGPETPLILDTLKYNNIKSIFFVTCTHIDAGEEKILQRAVREGHSIGLHGKTHRINEGYDSLKECKEVIENITGTAVEYYRPPYGFKAPRTMNSASELNLTVVLWSNFPRDYNAKSSEQIISRVTRNLKPGDIVCLHDGPEHREKTADAVQGIIDYEEN
jgi:peptidoglycan/xylan/chitin deacetylase (PgdA/CDA1 family)